MQCKAVEKEHWAYSVGVTFLSYRSPLAAVLLTIQRVPRLQLNNNTVWTNEQTITNHTDSKKTKVPYCRLDRTKNTRPTKKKHKKCSGRKSRLKKKIKKQNPIRRTAEFDWLVVISRHHRSCTFLADISYTATLINRETQFGYLSITVALDMIVWFCR